MKLSLFHIVHLQGQISELLQNNLIDTICNATAVTYFKVLSRNLQG